MPNPKDPVSHERALWRMVDSAARTTSGIGVPAAPGVHPPTMTLRAPTAKPQPQPEAPPSGAEEASAVDNAAAMYQLSDDINATVRGADIRLVVGALLTQIIVAANAAPDLRDLIRENLLLAEGMVNEMGSEPAEG
jgi:hypothetical protein